MQGAVTANQDSDDLRCWKECIEYDSQCDTDISSSGLRRSLLSQYGWQQMIKDKECGAITTCADQRTVQCVPFRPQQTTFLSMQSRLTMYWLVRCLSTVTADGARLVQS